MPTYAGEGRSIQETQQKPTDGVQERSSTECSACRRPMHDLSAASISCRSSRSLTS